MDIVVDQKQISTDERAQISKQVQADLVDHLYKGCLPGTISGVVASGVIFLDFYGYSPIYMLLAWVVIFNLMMVLLSALYFSYIKYKKKFNLVAWEGAYSIIMSGCALAWVPVIYLMPDVLTRQVLALIALFLATTGYATGTIGQFRLCIVTLSIILMPLIIWCFTKGGIFYNIVGAYSLIYFFFMLGANRRSTIWFHESLKLKLENTLVSYQANHDLLTGLPNQRLLPQYIESAISYVQNTVDTFALVCFSLNRMEMINDSFGHRIGDLIIQAVTKRLLELVSEEHKETTQYIITISRKDIFNILVVPCKPAEAENKIKKLFSVLEEPFYMEQKGIKLTASLGASFFMQDGKDAQSLLTNADVAMLKAKQFGGNSLEFYRTEINANLPKQLELETDLHKAIKNNELLLNYQPLIHIKTGQIFGMEALLRWRHPVHGLIPPVNFIPLAEETGLIIPIGEWVLQEACQQTLKWQQMGFPSLKIAINLAEKQLRQKNILSIVEKVLQMTGLNPHYLELEITETAILDEPIIHLIKKFKEMGVELSVDDFGTGYSGLSYLKRFSIDTLKIDQSFIRDIPINDDSMTIVSAIIAMAKELNVHVIAEGVETEEQLQFLKNKGCDYVQGYYFSKPLEVDFFTQFLMKNKETLQGCPIP